tara:strand:+ start:4479 stop:4781 length:303 start_codon:yes stop_codon:yes gene_type:complete
MAFKDKSTELAYYRQKAKEKKAFLIELKNVPCKDCGQRFHHSMMEFDHVPDRGKKKFCVANGGCYSLKEGGMLQDEIKKCDIVCANCHCYRTYVRKNPQG